MLMTAAVMLAAAPAAFAREPAPAARFTADDLFKLAVANSPAVSPDGRRIAYVRAAADVMTDKAQRSLWLVDAKGGPARRVAAMAGEQAAPLWSPDGKWLAFVARAPDTRPRLMKLDPASTAAPVLIAELPERPSRLAWSPDGTLIAYTAFVPGEPPRLGAAPTRPEGAKWAEAPRLYDQLLWRTDDEGVLKPGRAQVFTVPAAGGAPVQVTSGDFPISALAWDAGSRSLVVTTHRDADWQRDPGESELWRFALGGAGPVRLTTRKGPDGDAAMSPDGRMMAWIGHDAAGRNYAFDRLYVAAADGSDRRDLTASLGRSVANPVWDADGKALLVSYGDGGVTRLARVALDGKITPLTAHLGGGGLDRPYTGGSFDAAGGTIAFTYADAGSPGDIAVLRSGRETRLTDLTHDLRTARTLGTVRPLAVTAPDGRRIDTWVVLPPGYTGGRLPTILEIHGGPNAAYGPTFATDMQLYAAAGYAVVYPNARNSANYGDDFANQTSFEKPFSDAPDFLAAVDAAVAAGFADPDNLFVTGGSYGGYASAALIGLTDRFRAAALQKPVIDWNSKILTTDIAAYQNAMPYGAPVWDNPMGYWGASPISLVGRVKTPTLIVVGENDKRTPPPQSEEFFTALKLRGVPATLMIVPGAAHGSLTARPSQSAARVSAILAWFERYRKR
ncbi:S9 family peptidase [Parablastomonas sp. CN1-191]|uniref:S9 family peptidase n=1 Tax=Parablastomonas sp. CN1-191 TaxID=3400908 RepID=UPI003BF844BB